MDSKILNDRESITIGYTYEDRDFVKYRPFKVLIEDEQLIVQIKISNEYPDAWGGSLFKFKIDLPPGTIKSTYRAEFLDDNIFQAEFTMNPLQCLEDYQDLSTVNRIIFRTKINGIGSNFLKIQPLNRFLIIVGEQEYFPKTNDIFTRTIAKIKTYRAIFFGTHIDHSNVVYVRDEDFLRIEAPIISLKSASNETTNLFGYRRLN